jgi:hypothetical protein
MISPGDLAWCNYFRPSTMTRKSNETCARGFIVLLSIFFLIALRGVLGMLG